ncbi:AcrR family transcriptional regulator [Mycolicibacterium iranicum]|uniref:AcrR family transcriptional regulator n=1 Tax=Mycolicibacterium iranicum TaxID=912594 RepID=A0A839Q168_MYCIR|nr:TetR/AcrR family transcriptional regulator [Mycolicibacterium iranicum]MBB2988694.1 AcrR family transcriptional regulator [Mycolicibacterium iranicum]
MCDAAIALLAQDGPRGLSHLKVDRRAGVPDGTTSFYYRTRAALLRGVADQLIRYDAEAFTEAFKDAPTSSGEVIADVLARQILSIREEPQFSRTRARLELTMLATGDPDLAAGFEEMDVSFRALVGQFVLALQSGDVDPAILDEQATVLLAYLGGLIFAFANGSPQVMTRQDIARQMRAVIVGVAAERLGTH